VFLISAKGRFTLGTLRKGACEQFSVDLAVGEEFALEHTGGSTVHVTGWKQTLVPMDDEDEDEQEAREPAPSVAFLRSHSPQDEQVDDADEDEDDGEGWEEVEEEPEPAPAAGKKRAAAEALPPSAKRPAPPAAAAAKTPSKPASAAAGKTPANTPAKTPSAAAKPAATPESVSALPAAYEASLVAFLREHGRTGMSALGGSVKRPAGEGGATLGGVPKLGAFVKGRPTVFRVTGDQVELVNPTKK